MKKCNVCLAILEDERFGRYERDYLQSSCKECRRKTQKLKRQRNYDWVTQYKKSKNCSKCEESRWYVLEFHHKDSEDKDKEIARLVSNGTSLERIISEIDKCELLCANCHKEFHHLNKLLSDKFLPERTTWEGIVNIDAQEQLKSVVRTENVTPSTSMDTR
jgi:hypothetical protein